MYAKDIALRHTAQGQISFYGLEVSADDLDQDDCSVEVIRINDELDWRLRHLHRGGQVRVWHVVPCPVCERPIAVLRLENERVLRIVDAIQDPPEMYVVGTTNLYWTANIFIRHECPEDEQ